jgi:hypothetical protein
MSEVNLEEVLEEYGSATPAGNNLKILRSFTDKYPQYANDLSDFAAARAIIRHAPEEELSDEEERRFQESGLKSLRMVLSSLGAAESAPTALASLVETAKAKGLNRSKFAAAIGLSTSLVMYLEKRRLVFASIPQKIVAKISEVLGTGEELISAYLDQPPEFASSTSFKTESRPENSAPKSFAEAVRDDQILTPEEKRKLLDIT